MHPRNNTPPFISLSLNITPRKNFTVSKSHRPNPPPPMKKKLSKILVVLIAIPLVLIWLCNSIITNAAEEKTYTDTNEIPKNKVGLVLGTSKKMIGGLPNPYYT
jgi:vancomycin permeability regulator SanA